MLEHVYIHNQSIGFKTTPKFGIPQTSEMSRSASAVLLWAFFFKFWNSEKVWFAVYADLFNLYLTCTESTVDENVAEAVLSVLVDAGRRGLSPEEFSLAYPEAPEQIILAAAKAYKVTSLLISKVCPSISENVNVSLYNNRYYLQ